MSENAPALPLVSVIIPVYNDTERLVGCLKCLAAQSYPRDRLEVIVVDNGSRESPRERVEQFPFCTFAEAPTPGSYAARNRGLELARGEIIAFTDSDCLPAEDWLAEGVKALCLHPEPCFAGGRIVVFPRDEVRPTSVELYDVAFGLNQETNVGQLQHAATANMFAPAALFRSIGAFDASVKSGGDLEWGQRATEQGASAVFADRAVVRHPARTTYAEILRQTRRHVGGRFDRGRSTLQPRSRFHTWKTAWRNVVPNVRKIFRAKQRLREREYGLLAWLRTIPVILIVQYARVWEYFEKLLGQPSERR